jgi:replicative DNA helicase
MIDNLPPQNIEAEESILSSCLCYREDLVEFLDLLQPGDFYRTAHREIFAAMQDIYDAQEPVDSVTVKDKLNEKGLLEKIGGAVYLSRLMDAPVATNNAHYAKLLKDLVLRRRLIEIGNQLAKGGFENDISTEELLGRFQNAVMDLHYNSNGNVGNPVSMAELIKRSADRYETLYQSGESITGISTGFTDLDAMTSGLHKSDLIILAARPGMGKTALAACIAKNAANNGNCVFILSLEMSNDQLTDRLVSNVSGVNNQKIRRGRFSSDDWQRIVDAQSHLYELPINFDDTAALKCNEMRYRARREKVLHNAQLIIVDYLQLLQGNRGSGRVDEVSSITRSLKRMAKELDIPVLALSQLNRSCEQRDNKRPRLFDLRDSGSIEQDADVVAFIYRDEVYDKNTSDKGIAEIHIAKQRSGPTGTIQLGWNEKITQFFNLEKRY